MQPYKSLQVSHSGSTIRLLEILPSAHDDQPISTRLFLADLDADDRVSYEALSYTWGEMSSDGQRHYVHVNGYKQPVTPNLRSALSSLRDPCHSRTIWADSICINQADVQERGQQVTLMARIYTEASRVLVHLGPSMPSSAALFATLQRLADSTSDNTGKVADHHHRHHHRDHDQDHDDSDDEDDGSSTDPLFWEMCYDAGPDLVDGFIELCTRSWWTRMWVLQEYTLNKRDPVFYCGRLTISNLTLSKNFNKLYEWVEHKKRHPIALLEDCNHAACARPDKEDKEREKKNMTGETDVPDKDDPKDARRMIRAQGSRGREWSVWGNRVWRANHVLARRIHCSPFSMPFYSTLGLQSRCTIPHDAVYGLRELMDQLFRSLFPPDYAMPLSLLFSRLAAYLLVVDFNMDIFWFFPHRLRDRTPGEVDGQTGGNVVVPSWVPDFTRPRPIREAEAMPFPSKPRPELWHHAPHIFDRVLFMNGFLLDEIVAVYPLPLDDPFLLLQQLWYVERTYMSPAYLKDVGSDDGEDEEERKDNFDRMIDLLGGVTAWPSIVWAAEHSDRLGIEISIVEILKGLTNLSLLILPTAEKYPDKIPDVVDLIISKEQTSTERATEADEDLDIVTSDLAQAVDGIDLTSDDADSSSTVEPDRRARIFEMKRRLNGLAMFLVEEPTWTDFIGICTFDYHNFRAQVLHRLCIVSAQVVGDMLGDDPAFERLKTGLGPRYQTSECAVTHEPLSYRKFIDAIEDGACHPLEVRLREGFVIDWAEKIHRVMADMVGLEGDTAFKPVDRGVPAQGVPAQDKSEKNAMEASRNFVCMIPVPYSEKEDGGEERETDETEPSSLGLPHSEEGHPFGAYYRWKFLPRKVRYDVHTTLQCVVELLTGREFFVTETGLVGLAGVDTKGVQDGDDLLLIEGMSNPLIARLEPSPELGTPKKRRREMSTRGMRREIVGTSVVKGIDTKDGKVGKATWPSWFEPLVEKRGRYRFC